MENDRDEMTEEEKEASNALLISMGGTPDEIEPKEEEVIEVEEIAREEPEDQGDPESDAEEESEDLEDPEEEDEEDSIQSLLKEEEEEDSEDEEEPEKSGSNFAQVMREKVSKANAALEKEKQKAAEAEEELARLKAELDANKAELDKFSASQIDPATHPDYKAEAASLIRDIEDGLMFADADTIPQAKWPELINDARKMVNTPASERKAVRDEFKLKLAKMAGFLDEDDDSFIGNESAESKTNAAARVFVDGDKKYAKLQELFDDIRDKAANKRLALGHEDYERKVKPVRERLAKLASMDEELINDDPYSLQSQASIILKEDAKLSKHVQKALEQYRFGRRELSQSEIDQLEAAGKNIEEHIQTMDKKVQSDNDALDSEFAVFLTLRPKISKALREYAKEKDKESKSKENKQRIRNLTKNSSAPRKEKTKTPEEEEEEAKAALAKALGV